MRNVMQELKGLVQQIKTEVKGKKSEVKQDGAAKTTNLLGAIINSTLKRFAISFADRNFDYIEPNRSVIVCCEES